MKETPTTPKSKPASGGSDGWSLFLTILVVIGLALILVTVLLWTFGSESDILTFNSLWYSGGITFALIVLLIMRDMSVQKRTMDVIQAQTATTGRKKLRAFAGQSANRTPYITRLRRHAAAGDMDNMQFKADYPSSAVGFTVHHSDPLKFQEELGIPAVLAEAQDAIFQYLPPDKRHVFPERFLNAALPGVDLTNTWWLFAQFLIQEAARGFAFSDRERELIEDIASYYEHGTTNGAVWDKAIAQLEKMVQACSKPQKGDDAAQTARRKSIAHGVYSAALIARNENNGKYERGLVTNVIVMTGSSMMGRYPNEKYPTARIQQIYEEMAQRLLQSMQLAW